MVVKIKDGKEKPEWLRDDFWTELCKQDEVKAKSKFMSHIVGGRPATDGLAPIIAVGVGAELVSVGIQSLHYFVYKFACTLSKGRRR